jgi:tetratricopeptide (TPR) repeat protein
MALDAYSPCPCGSGKKFKWCCQPIYATIQRAFAQEAEGQHDTALRLMDEVTAQHAGNPEAWGQKATLLAQHGKFEEAEAALEKAFALNPNYPYGLMLRARMRHHEGEAAGALLLARKAALHYAADAREYLARVYDLIADCEIKLNRPVAARAALQVVLSQRPGDPELQAAFDGQFGSEGPLPLCARQEYALLPPAPARKAAWDRARQAIDNPPRLPDLVRVYEPLTREDPTDAAAWYNLGLVYAWLGDNRAALDALNRYLEREADEGRAETAAALMEVLRCGAGLEDDCDYHEYSFAFQLRDPAPMQALLQEWHDTGRLVQVPTGEEGVFFALLLELTRSGLITAGLPGVEVARLAGYLTILGPNAQVRGADEEAVGRLREQMRERLRLNLGEAQEKRRPARFADVVSEAISLPTRGSEGAPGPVENAQKYYEEKWPQQARKSLSGNTPVDAASHTNLRKKLRGVVRFIADCAVGGMLNGVDFDKVRRKLGLLAGESAAPAASAGAAPDPASMGAAELAGLKADVLSDEQLEQAFQSAQKLDAQELAAHFARSLVGRPANAARPDRYPAHAYLIQRALAEGQLDAALDHVNEGERADCEQNEGRRRNDYELRRAQVHTRRGEADQAEDTYRRLIERVPDQLKYRGSAAEAMLTLKQPTRALKFAEEGIEQARRQKDRDSEQYLLELAGAAKKQLR